MVDTIRKRIITEYYTNVLPAMVVGTDKVWQRVYRGDITDISNVQTPGVSVDEGTEIAVKAYGGCAYYDLPVFFHFRWMNKREVENLDTYQYYLGLLQQAVLADHQLGGLSIGIQEESNSPAIVGQNDPNPGGVLSIIVQYRTMLHNPYKLPGEA